MNRPPVKTFAYQGDRYVSVLDEILVGVRADVEARQRAMPLEALKAKAAKRRHPVDGVAALRCDAVTVIAEVKRSSPSRGEIAAIADPAALARASVAA
jgi:indole-3-glycerol phosphate synthase